MTILLRELLWKRRRATVTLNVQPLLDCWRYQRWADPAVAMGEWPTWVTLLWPWKSGQPEWPCCGHGRVTLLWPTWVILLWPWENDPAVASLSDPAASWQCHVGWPLRNGFLYKSETTTNKTSLGLKGEGWFLGWIKVGFALYGNNPLPLCAARHWWVSQLFMEGLSTVTSPCCAPCSVK